MNQLALPAVCPIQRALATGLRTEVVRSARELPCEWDVLVQGAGLVLQRHYLAAMDAAPPENAHQIMVLAWDGPELRGGAVFHVVALKVGQLGTTEASAHWSVRWTLAGLGWLGGGTPHLLLCGNVLHSDAPGFVHAGVDDPAGLLRSLADAARAAVEVPVHLVICTAADLGAAADDADGQGFHRVRTAQPTMRVELRPEWADMDDYLGAMRSKYRQRARSARKKGRDLVRRELSLDELAASGPVFDALMEDVLDGAEVVLSVPRAPQLAAMKRALGDDMRVRLYLHEDRPVAFSVSLFDGLELDAMLVGMDDGANRSLKLYQNILYDYVEEGIERGARAVAMGRCALEIKSTVGAEPHHMDVFVQHPRLLPHLAVGLALRQLEAEDWTPRSPFK